MMLPWFHILQHKNDTILCALNIMDVKLYNYLASMLHTHIVHYSREKVNNTSTAATID